MGTVPRLLWLVGLLLVAGPAWAESWSQRVTREKPDENVAVQVERLAEDDVGEFLQYRVTVKLKSAGGPPRRSHALRMFHGDEFVSSCELQSTGPDGARVFSFRVARKYAEKSTFSYNLSSDFDSIGYWFYLGDFAPPK